MKKLTSLERELVRFIDWEGKLIQFETKIGEGNDLINDWKDRYFIIERVNLKEETISGQEFDITFDPEFGCIDTGEYIGEGTLNMVDITQITNLTEYQKYLVETIENNILEGTSPFRRTV